MNLCSMTGYGHGAAIAGGLKIEVELSSVNRKQLDLSINLPRTLGVLESRVHEAVRRVIARGRVTVDITVHRSARARAQSVRVDEPLAAAYLKALRRAAARLGLSGDFEARTLLALPDVLNCDQPDEEAERMWPLLARALDSGLAALRRMRAREGAALQRDLLRRVGALETHLRVVRKNAPAVVARYRRSLLARLEQAGFTWDKPDERLLRELALFADKCDITEETTRLASHLRQARDLLRGREAAGRPLDFLLQEIMREINTIGSKANDAAILQRVVAFKAEVERIREQVQNIE